MLETILLILAGLGLLTVIVGRHIMIRDSIAEVTFLWHVALRLVPFSELIYMVRHPQAITGGIISLTGMWLIVPYAGHELWQSEDRARVAGVRFQRGAAGPDGQSPVSTIPEELLQKHRLGEKERKIFQLNSQLASWHEQLQKKRAILGTDPTSVQAFNDEAAAYSAFNALTREENAELAGLRAKTGKPRMAAAR